mgnify:FL=1
MDFFLSQLASFLPAEIDFLSMMKFILLFTVISLVIGLLGRAVFGRRSALNHAVSSAMGILFVYVLTIVIFTFNPSGLSRFLTPLPFVQLTEDCLYILPLHEVDIPTLCENLLSLIILAFLMNLLDSLIPKGKSLIGWYLRRFLSIILAMALHYLVNWASHTYLPGLLVTYAPILLLGILIVMLLLGFLNIFLSLVLAAVNPILGGIYTFFFSNILGKQLSKSMLTTALITGVVYVLEQLGYSVICIAAAALVAYIPLIIVLLMLWYMIGHLL